MPGDDAGLSVLAQADQYSLGCVLYECLTGRVPFEKDLDAAIIWAHVEETPTRPTALRPDLPPEIDEVFARVLAKRPDERYESCREFIDAARVALGVLPAGQATAGYPGSLVLDQVAGAPTERVAAGFQAVQAQQGGTMASHRQPASAAPPRVTGHPDGHQPPAGPQRPRRGFLRPRWIAALTALILIAVGAGTWALVNSGSGSHARAAGTSSTTAKPEPPSALMSALILANQTTAAKGDLPPSTCRQQGTTKVTCYAPAPGIYHVIFQTYPSLTALYSAYVALAGQLNSGRFQANFQDCGLEQTVGEVSWNHQFQHPKTYSVAQSSSGKLTDDQAAGRVYCNFANGEENMIWTQNDGHLLAWVMGPLHESVWNWWLGVHHNIGFSNSPMNM